MGNPAAIRRRAIREPMYPSPMNPNRAEFVTSSFVTICPPNACSEELPLRLELLHLPCQVAMQRSPLRCHELEPSLAQGPVARVTSATLRRQMRGLLRTLR